MLEPFQDHYGGSVVTVLYLVALCADIIWAATILAVLGKMICGIFNPKEGIYVYEGLKMYFSRIMIGL